MQTNHNSLVNILIGYVRALFCDIEYAYPRPSGFQRDLSRMLHELEARGSRLVTLDLPALGKHFDKCLGRGLYTPSGLPFGSPVSGGKVPAFLQDLYLQVFDLEGKLRQSPRVEAITALRVLFVSAKKLRLQNTERSLRDEIKNFILIEEAIRSPSLNWSGEDLFGLDDQDSGSQSETLELVADDNGDRTRDTYHSTGRRDNTLGRKLREIGFTDLYSERSPQLSFLEDHTIDLSKEELACLQLVADCVSSSFGDFHSEDPEDLPRHGPGVTANLKAGVSKYQFMEWPSKLDAMFPYDRYATYDYAQTRSKSQVVKREYESPSRLIAVPKTQKAPRLIAAEPNEHQWIQQLVWKQLESRLVKTPISSCISFRDQRGNGELARQSSRDGRFATIDLSSASDRLSCYAVERFFRANLTLLERLHACRTRWLTYRSDDIGFTMKLKKFAAMGSACTFPVQTVCYAITAIAAVLHDRGIRPTLSSIKRASSCVRVFGDDIIVDTKHSGTLIRMLTGMGLRVNDSKTFTEGNFRESCGVDAWDGYDVTPPYLLEIPVRTRGGTLSSLVEVRNNFYSKGYWRVAFWLDAIQGLGNKVPVKGISATSFGISSCLGDYDEDMRKRYSHTLHRWERLSFFPIGKTQKVGIDAYYSSFQYFIERPSPEVEWTAGVVVKTQSLSRLGWVPCY